MTNYTQVLLLNYPGTCWSLNGTAYEGLDWKSEVPKPTQAELDALWPQTQLHAQNKFIDQQRQESYEQEADPLFFKAQRGDSTQEEWLAKIAEIKARFPRPE